MAGAGAGSFGAGFAKGLANVLLSNRQEQTRKAERQQDVDFRNFSSTFPIIFSNFQQNPTPEGAAALEDMIVRINPEMAKQIRRGGFSFETLGPLLSQPTKVTEMNEAGLPREVAGPPTLEARSGAMTQMPDQTTRLFGAPVLTPEQKASREREMALSDLITTIAARRDIASQMGKSPQESVDFGLYGTRPPTRTQEPFAPVTGTMPDGKTVSGVFDQTTGQYLDPQTRQPLVGFVQGTRTGGAQTDFDDFLASYAKDKGKSVADLSAPERLDARQQFAKAGHVATAQAGGPNADALARLAARNPAVLQGLTPTVTSQVMGAIAADPSLQAQFEQTRMQPIRTGAERVLAVLDDLLVTNKETGEVTGLTPGAQDIYGAAPLGRLSRFMPGSQAATAKAALDQVTGSLTLDIIQAMKAQSRTGATGFGQLSDRELSVLESAASVLKGEISEARALQELKAIRERFSKIMQPAAGELGLGGAVDRGAAAAGKPYQDNNGNWVVP